MKSVLTTEPAVLFHFESVGIIFLVLHSVVIPLLAFRANECDSNSVSLSHSETPPDNYFISLFADRTRQKNLSAEVK